MEAAGKSEGTDSACPFTSGKLNAESLKDPKQLAMIREHAEKMGMNLEDLGLAPKSSQQESKCPFGGDLSTRVTIGDTENEDETDIALKIKKNEKRDAATEDEDTDDEEEEKGGCPVMKKEKYPDPHNYLLKPAYELPNYQIAEHLLDFEGLVPSKELKAKREKFDSYPIFVRATLLMKEDPYRRLDDIMQKFLVFDERKRAANKAYKRGKYYEAIIKYQQALGIFRWLQHKKENFNFDIPIEDEDIELIDPQGRDSVEDDVRLGCLVQAYRALASCYLRVKQFSNAVKACDEGLKLHKDADLLFRKSQAQACNLATSLSDLKRVHSDLGQLSSPKADGEIFADQKTIFGDLISQKENATFELYKTILTKVKHILEKRKKLREENKQSVVNMTSKHINFERRMLSSMLRKYKFIFEFMITNDKVDMEQLETCQEEYQTLKGLQSQFRQLLKLDPQKDEIAKDLAQSLELNLMDPDVMAEIQHLVFGKIKSLFNNSEFNMDVFNACLREIYLKDDCLEGKKPDDGSDKIAGKEKRNILGLGFSAVVSLVLVLGFVASFIWFGKEWMHSGIHHYFPTKK